MDDVEAAMKGMLEPTYEEKVTGNLTVRETGRYLRSEQLLVLLLIMDMLLEIPVSV